MTLTPTALTSAGIGPWQKIEVIHEGTRRVPWSFQRQPYWIASTQDQQTELVEFRVASIVLKQTVSSEVFSRVNESTSTQFKTLLMRQQVDRYLDMYASRLNRDPTKYVRRSSYSSDGTKQGNTHDHSDLISEAQREYCAYELNTNAIEARRTISSDEFDHRRRWNTVAPFREIVLTHGQKTLTVRIHCTPRPLELWEVDQEWAPPTDEIGEGTGKMEDEDTEMEGCE